LRSAPPPSRVGTTTSIVRDGKSAARAEARRPDASAPRPRAVVPRKNLRRVDLALIMVIIAFPVR
jgi:hypothetical protein